MRSAIGARAYDGAALLARLDTPLPASLAAGRRSFVLVAGWCTRRARRLEVVVDGVAHEVRDHGLPRLDVLRATGEGYRSGFYALVPVQPPARLVLRADGEEAVLGSVAAHEPPAPAEREARIAIAMATHEPPPGLLRRQLDSIRAQDRDDWVCVISDDASSPAAYAALVEAVGDDPRFVVSRSPRRLGFYANFERALALVPRGAPLVALADQDDRWDPDKLSALEAALGDAVLVYSDARLVRPDGTPIAPTYWGARRNEHDDLRRLLVANSVTGAASLLRREVLDVALPFPPGQFAHFHDHWLAVCARALGRIAYLDRATYDYVQHGDAVLGHAAANRVVRVRERVALGARERVRTYRQVFWVDVLRLRQMALTVLDRTTPPRRERRALEGVLGERPLGLWVRGVRDAAAPRTATLGAERGLAYAMAWRRLVGLTTTDAPRGPLRLDALPPTELAPRPGRRAEGGPARVVAEKVAPLALAPGDDEPPRVNVLLPTIDLDHLFGGYIGKLNLARRLAERGARVRLVTVDPTPPLPADWRERVQAYAGLEGVLDRVEVAFAREAGVLPVSREDRFVATTWWTAHVADAARRSIGAPPFLYLVQEHEPMTFPHGTWAALAEQSYRFDHAALFSTELLRTWFRARGLGVFARPGGDERSLAFSNAITDVAPAGDLAGRGTRRLLFYARPEPHAARNLFELGCLAIARAAPALAGWELRGIGTTALGRRVALGDGAVLELVPRTAQRDYAAVLREHDVGVALMHTPHPSLVPIEMAAAGMLTVTTSYETKTPEALAAISPNLRAVPAEVDALAEAIAGAAGDAGDVAARLRGAEVAWPRDWDAALDDALMARVEQLLR